MLPLGMAVSYMLAALRSASPEPQPDYIMPCFLPQAEFPSSQHVPSALGAGLLLLDQGVLSLLTAACYLLHS